MKILVYTAITNNHDDLKHQEVFEKDNNKGIEYRAYLDSITMETIVNKDIISQWQIELVTDKFKEPKRNCQIYKILSHLYGAGFDYTVWIDGSVKLKTSISKLIKDNINETVDISLLRHSERDSIYKESWDCKHFKLDYLELIDEQMAFYKAVGFPDHFGLSETPVIIRRNTRAVRNFNNMWWAIISRYSKRDQLSFDFARWTLSMPINYIEGNIHNNDYFEIAKHKVLREHERL